MLESRDRLIRKEPETPLIFPRRSIGGVWVDTAQKRRLLASQIQFGATSTMTRQVGGANNNGRSGRARARDDSSLPSWYRRRPLQDITSVTDAIERRRACMREAESHRLPSPLQPNFNTLWLQQESTTPVFGAPLEHKIPLERRITLSTRKPKDAAITSTHFPVHIFQTAFHDNISQGEFEFMTPQKKLLNSIDQVDKVMKEEFKRMRRTPSAKRAERDNKVRMLMTMR